MIRIERNEIEISGEAIDIVAEYHLLTTKLYMMLAKKMGNEKANELFTRILFESVKIAGDTRRVKFGIQSSNNVWWQIPRI